MTDSVPRDHVTAFYAAYSARDVPRIAEFLADDVEWTISGPVDLLPFCGRRQGRDAVLDVIQRLAPNVIRIFSFVPNQTLIDGDRVATLNRLSATRVADGRVISYRLAHFLRFRDLKIVEALSLIDSYDAVEQVLGHPLAVADAPPMTGEDNLVAL